ncbi:hypothetical protein BCR34DRAFT_671094 [Clohesyomyces aquaticus]|uniref:L-lysine 2,3-aminomutase n=1 Tax=Clohesyomyces aquaticus TaxID=1231657 RepID=A0A1Y2A6Y0_9PLEO|nr:hypothetical protein BCR34DRAFT_671094 [Clohesyomyces aquaticus]
MPRPNRIQEIFLRFGVGLEPMPYVAAAQVFPMRVNNYVLENLIDWSRVPNDPIFQLVFPQPEMLSEMHLKLLLDELKKPDTSRVDLRKIAEMIRCTLNAHPAGQKDENVPRMNGHPVPGLQHKYRETILFFPMEGQFCHSYCTYCFRWAQFTSVGSEQQFKSKSRVSLVEYLEKHPFVTDVLFTGGDPMVMSSSILRGYIEPLLKDTRARMLATVRIGSKSLAYWPYRYTTDPDAKDILDLFTEIVASGKHLAFQAHFSHPRELQTPAVQEAIRLINMTGAQIRCQAPLIRHVNNAAETWREMWALQTRLGIIPYYMFVERDTGPRDYFAVPLAEAYDIFSDAYKALPGTARTVRGPSMSASPGKVSVVGIERIGGERVFVLKFFQGRNPEWTKRVFFAAFNPNAVWLDELKPAFGQEKWFFEDAYREIASQARVGASGQLSFGV